MKSLRLFLWLTLLTGLIYPLCITLIATTVMPTKAGGSLLTNARGEVVGSLLIAQPFEDERYFWPRPSFTHYNTLPSGASNWGPTNQEFHKQVAQRKETIGKAEGQDGAIPSDLLFNSGSGLDPHISYAAALFQAPRVAKARKLKNEDVIKTIEELASKRRIGFIGIPRVNVLQLNLYLDGWEKDGKVL